MQMNMYINRCETFYNQAIFMMRFGSIGFERLENGVVFVFVCVCDAYELEMCVSIEWWWCNAFAYDIHIHIFIIKYALANVYIENVFGALDNFKPKTNLHTIHENGNRYDVGPISL